MNAKNYFLSFLFSIVFISCSSSKYFYQVCKTTPDSNISMKENFLVYEDANCKVSYNLWVEGGNVGFQFYNKTESNIYLNLEECFFISNGMANNYFKNRVYTTSTNIGSSQSIAKSISGINYLKLDQTNSASLNTISTNGISISSNEDKIVCIPALTSKIVKEYSINQTPYRDCDLLRFPDKKELKTLSFKLTNSPIVFSNKIEYKVGQSGNPIKFENKFFVSEITNYPKSEIIESKFDTYCGENISSDDNKKNDYFKKVSPDKFYTKYIWGFGELKH